MIYYSNKAAVLVNMKKYDEVLAVIDLALEKYPDSKKDFVKLGKLYARKSRAFELKGDIELAIEWIEKSLLENGDWKCKKKLNELLKIKQEKEKQDYIQPELAEQHIQNGNELYKKA